MPAGGCGVQREGSICSFRGWGGEVRGPGRGIGVFGSGFGFGYSGSGALEELHAYGEFWLGFLFDGRLGVQAVKHAAACEHAEPWGELVAKQ